MSLRSLTVLILLALSAPYGCAPPKSNNFTDKTLVRIADWTDRRLSDSLYQFFKSENAAHRSAAVLAFASIQDSVASPALGTLLLEDASPDVRARAAYALGQTGGFASVNALIPAAQDKEPAVVREVLEALGKTITQRDLNAFKDFHPVDSIAEEGFALGMYRLALRRISDSVLTQRMGGFLDLSHVETVRLRAAQFFSRVPADLNSVKGELSAAALNDPAPEVRMNAASALRKVKVDEVRKTLATIITGDRDYRVRVNATRALQPFPLEQVWNLYSIALKDSNANVGIAAAELLKDIVKKPDSLLDKQAASAKNGRIRAALYEAVLAVNPSPSHIERVKNLFNNAQDDYERAQLLSALSKAIAAHEFVFDKIVHSRIAVIKTAAATALCDMNRRPDFTPELKTKFADLYRQAVLDGDAAVAGIVAGALGDSLLGYNSILKNTTFLKEARVKLLLPRDIESLQPLEDAIAYLDRQPKSSRLKNTYNHPIDWNLVSSIPATQRALIKTSKGDITIELLVNEAPGSVANFVDLTKRKYYEGRFVHRVVPNFVVQTGCVRGDGFGSEDYSIRSDFSMRRYTRGSVGYASAGKDTEGTQWFITHSATSHLDGRYSIFAVVTDGMGVVDRIEAGDTIQSITLIEN